MSPLTCFYVCAEHITTPRLSESKSSLASVSPSTGSVCTTRKKTGVGYPQLSAVIECADAAHGLGGHIISVSDSSMIIQNFYTVKDAKETNYYLLINYLLIYLKFLWLVGKMFHSLSDVVLCNSIPSSLPKVSVTC